MATPKTLEDFKKKYPKLFRLHGVGYFEFSINSGWFRLLDKMCAELMEIEDTPAISVVKEKFGLMRTYFDYTGKVDGDTNAYNIVDKYEELSGHVCEFCGKKSPGVRSIPAGTWLKSYCKRCEKEGW